MASVALRVPSLRAAMARTSGSLSRASCFVDSSMVLRFSPSLWPEAAGAIRARTRMLPAAARELGIFMATSRALGRGQVCKQDSVR
jgi:hypothetical protein